MLTLYPSDILRQKSKNIDNVRDHYLTVSNMKRVVEERNALGLAAVQIGQPLRIIIINTLVYPMTVMHNPDITAFHGHPEFGFEECLSLPGVMVNVPRFPKIHVSYYDELGEPATCVMEGVSAIVAQHEIDHLNGKLIIDYGKRKVYMTEGFVYAPYIPDFFKSGSAEELKI